jgi:hypothetical protein
MLNVHCKTVHKQSMKEEFVADILGMNKRMSMRVWAWEVSV